MEIAIVIILLVLGIVFLLLEIFLFPGISVAGIAGALFTGASVWYAYTHIGATAGHITLGGGTVLLGIAIWLFIKSKALERMSLKTNVTGKVESIDEINGPQIILGSLEEVTLTGNWPKKYGNNE